MSTVVDLTQLGSRGFVIQGDAAGDLAGWSVSNAGDVNGDGFDDIIIGAPYNDVGTPNAGSAYVIYGHSGGFGPIDLSNLSAAQGFRISGTHVAGLSVSGAGDVNGDGFDDVIVATYSHGLLGYGMPQTYVVFGKATPSATIDLAHLAPSDGFSVSGPPESSYYADYALSVSSAGDVNGDGFDDIIIGARYANNERGAAYVVYGKPGGFGGIDLNNLGPSVGFAIQGSSPHDLLGTSVASAGDINGDGFDDLIVGAPGGDLGGTDAGQVYVIFGHAGGSGPIDVSSLSASQGFVIKGHNVNDFTGRSVSGAGDVNGDGFGDIIIGSPFASTDAAYVIFGKATGFGTIDLNNLGTAGFMIQGINADAAGRSVSPAGDVNHDGFDDLLVGTNSSGAYVIFGKAGGFGTIDLANLAPAAGFLLQGTQGTGTGWSVAGGGDINHDGFADLVIGAPFASAGGSNAGQVYVVSGRSSLAEVRNDFNGDGRSDFLLRNDDGTVTNWLAQPGGALSSNSANFQITASPNWHVIALADLNGDGRDDILWRSDDGTVTDWLATASGAFLNNWNNFHMHADAGWHIIGTGDFNGDGFDDLLWRADDGTVTNSLGTANGSFASNSANFTLHAVSPDWQIIQTGDFNGDGRDDILWRSADGTITDWLGLPNGAFVSNSANFTLHAVSPDWQIIKTGDFNGDGRDDILWRSADGTITDWLGLSNGTFTNNFANFHTHADPNWQVVGAGDFNGDGIDDVLWRSSSGQLSTWVGTTSGSLDSTHGWTGSAATSWQVQDSPTIF